MPAHPLCYLVDPMRAQTSDSHKLSSNSREHSGTCTHDRYKNVKKEKEGNLFKKYIYGLSRVPSQKNHNNQTPNQNPRKKSKATRLRVLDSEMTANL